LVIVVVVTLAVLGLAIVWSARPRSSGFATPADCIDAFCDASKEGDPERYLSSLAEPLRSETRQRFLDDARLAEHLRLQAQGVLSRVQHLQSEGPAAVVDLEEVRDSSARVTRFHLEPSARGWLIVRIEPSVERPLSFRLGAPVDEGRTGSEPRVEP
jgi:hypothetical protein